MSSEYNKEYQQQVAALEADKEAYIAAIESAAVLASDYSGSEPQYEALIEALDAIEAFARKHAAVLPGEGVVQKETYLANKWQFAEVPLTVSDLLEFSAETLNQKIATDIRALRLHTIETTILPPGDGEIKVGEGKSEFVEPKFEERLVELVGILQEIGVFTDDLIITRGKNQPTMVRQESYIIVEIPRLARTVLVCNQVGEATFVIYGTISRQTLTSLSKAELLATYPTTIHRVVRDSYAQWKTELLKHLVPFGEPTKPRSRNYIRPKETKLDVGAYDEMRELVKKYHTPESWVALLKRPEQREPGKEKITHAPFVYLSVAGYGLRAIATQLGQIENPFAKINYLKLGLVIWGEDNAVIRAALDTHLGGRALEEVEKIENRTPEEWRAVIKNRYTAEQWVGLIKAQQVNKLEIDGKKLDPLAVIFGVKEGTSRIAILLELGMVIFDRDPVVAKAVEVLNRSLDGWREAIKKEYTPEKWVALLALEQSDGERADRLPLFRKTEIDGKSISRLCGQFGIVEQPWSMIAFLKLGLAIWGKDDPILKFALVEHAKKVPALLPRQKYDEEYLAEINARVADQWRQIIKERYTPQEWFKVIGDARKGWVDLEVDSKKLTALSTVFGLNGRGKSYLDFLKLTLAIWGEDDSVVNVEVHKFTSDKTIEEFEKISARTIEEWRAQIKELYTPAQWVKMATMKGVSSLVVDGRKVKYIQNAFSLATTNKPVEDFLNLGLLIWGEEQSEILAALAIHRDNLKPDELVAIEARTVEDWKKVLQTKYTPVQWVEMSRRGGIFAFKVDGKQTKAISTLLGFGNDNGEVYTTPGFLELGLIIWPEDPIITAAWKNASHGMSAEQRAKTKERTVEEWQTRIKELYTPEQWLDMASGKGRGRGKDGDMRNILIDGKKVAALFGIFGIKKAGDNRGSLQFLKLGLEIWREGNELLKQALELESRTVEQWGEAIKKKYTVEDWVALAHEKGIHQFEVDERKISSILNVFGIKTHSPFSMVNFLTLGLRLWGQDQPLIKKRLEEHLSTHSTYVLVKGFSADQLKEIEARTVVDWINIIKERFTPETWIHYAKSNATAVDLSLDTKKINALIAIFGIEDKFKEANAVLKIGEIVWGANDPVIKKTWDARVADLAKIHRSRNLSG